MLAQIRSLANIGLSCHDVTVEVASARGEDRMIIVGLGDTAVKESKQRVWMALHSSGFRIPTGRT
ncbi:magnesium chelatase, partial [Candidatus Peregrinibacteria bacterium]|nr:magnesium chelatase [Candidatus Peregrinibacteria bacterium]